MAVQRSPAAPAPQLGERPGTFSWWSLRQEFALTPTRLRSAVKFALGTTLVMVLAFLFNWPAATGMAVALVITRSDSHYDLPQALVAAFTAGVAGAFYYWSLRYSQNLPLFVLVLGGGFIVLGALTTLPGFGVAISIGMVAGSSLLTGYFYQPNARSFLFLPFTSQLLLGFAAPLVVQFALWPYSPRQEWDESFRRIWNECRRVCARWFAGEQAPARPDALDHQTKEIFGLTSQRVHPVDPADEGVAIRTAASRRIQEVIMLLHDLQRLGRGRSATDEPAAQRQLGGEFDRHFAGLESLLTGKGKTPAGSLRKSGWKNPLVDGQAGEDRISETDLLRREDLRRLRATLDECSESFRAMALLRQAESVTQRDQSFNWVPAFKLQDLRQFGTAQPWQRGVKVALLVLSCLLFWQAFRWPNGGTVLSSAIIVNLPDVGSSARKAITRVYGLLLGLLCALLCTLLVVRYVETIFGYGLCVFLTLACLGYLCGASSRVNYAGFQAATSFVLTFIGDDRQSVSLDALRTRFVGLVAGVVIAEIILRGIHPVRKVKDMFKGLADNFALCAQAWCGLFQATPEEFPARRKEFIKKYNQGFAGNIALNDSIEFEGSEGSARYGYSGRLLVHEDALFEQMRLIGMDWTRLARGGKPLPAEFDAIRQRFATLAERLGHPVDLPPFPAGADHPETADPDPTGQRTQHLHILEQRLQQVESILASMDRLTALPSTA